MTNKYNFKQSQKTKKLLIFGNSDMARMAHFYFDNDSSYEVVAFTIDEAYINSATFCNLPLVPFHKIKILYPNTDFECFVAVGYKQMNLIRERFYLKVLECGYKTPSYISSKATILTSDIGDNCFIFEDNTLQPFVKIGNNTILWSGNHIGHDSVIEDNCFISSHVVISGHCSVGKNCFVGVNSTIANNVKISDFCYLSMSAIVAKDLPKFSLVKYDGSQSIVNVKVLEKITSL